ncbi:MAG TPA: hypothetical protein PKM41_01415 [Deltaproteobacteria bacterium]|nr:hypothetical protein [Deltaproteobacteria bacterium]HOI07017.1 hypothetical protein [Deltaproteobacteria bacterium]
MVSKKACVLAAAAIIATGLFLGCSSSPEAPKEIQGVWKTLSEESADVAIEFTPEKIIISSETGVVENTITRVKAEKGHLHNSMLYSIYYSDQFKETNLMNVLYSPEDGGTIRFKSEQDVVWKKSR